MKIKNLENLDAGISGIEIEGDVVYTQEPKNKKGTRKDGKKYDFWSSFIVLEDDTGTMGCSITVKEGDTIEEDDHLKVKGKLNEYEDDAGEVQRVLNGRIVKDREKKGATGEKANNGKDKDLHIARMCAVKGAIEMITADKIKPERLVAFSEGLVKYIYEGPFIVEAKVKEEEPVDREESPESARHTVRGKKLEIREGHEDDKIIDDEDLPGSSYDNPIPRNKKKISKVEDFIQEDTPE